ncbi:MAG: hypothetical protein A2W46_06565 [Alphaproteobacteria bacterium RIFCSPHIGHO2_12_42_13]|nr:MAG: hypothetical protein A2W46_06565 [Alphaproteobacteria bacterium RIFCSPHIGHO2_12_42_13]
MGVMEDAVVPADGYPYERAAILRHFEENGGFKALMQLIKKGNKELSRISEGFIKTLFSNWLSNYLEGPNTQNFSLTESLRPEKKLKKLITYMEFCKHVYTDDDTRGFVAARAVPTMTEKWSKIISNKREIDRLYRNLSTIREKKDDISKQSLIFKSDPTIIVPGVQVPALPREAQHPKLEEDYTDCIEDINTFLQKILNRGPIDHKKLKDITLAMRKLEEIKKEIYDEFSWHFQEETSKPNATITDSADGKKYPLTSSAVVAASFLHKTQLLLKENITILDVGFRHLNDLKGIFNIITERIVRLFKDNPTAWFEEWGEVDYVAYIEEDKTFKRKDKLVIVYSGSNSSKDWVSNITIGHTPALNLSVHEGIGTLFQTTTATYHNLLIDKIKHYYKNHRTPNNLKVITTGHSLGGALALLAAYYYKTTQIQNLCDILEIDKDKISVKTLTFAAPAIADEPSKKSIEARLERNNIFRISTLYDPVVSLSGKLVAWHVGRNFPLCNIANNTFNLLDELWGPHLAVRYLCYLRAALQEPLSEPHTPLFEPHTELISILKKHIISQYYHQIVLHQKVLNFAGNRTITEITTPTHLPSNPIAFSNLEELNVSSCPNLQRIILTAPKLKRLIASECPNLMDLRVEGTSLITVDLRGAQSLKLPTFSVLLRRSHPQLIEVLTEGARDLSPVSEIPHQDTEIKSGMLKSVYDKWIDP